MNTDKVRRSRSGWWLKLAAASSNSGESDPPIDSIKRSQLSEQFSDATRIVRRNLIIASAAAILLGLPDIRLGAFLGLDLTHGSAGKLAIGAVALAAAYELVSFVTYGVIDRARWIIEPGAILLNHVGEDLEGLERQVNEVRNYLGEMADTWADPVAAPQLERLRAVADEADRAMLSYKRRLAAQERQLESHNVVQRIRIYFLDWGVPIVLGVIATVSNIEEINRLLVVTLSVMHLPAFGCATP